MTCHPEDEARSVTSSFSAMDDTATALEEFRQRWREEVSAKSTKYERQPPRPQAGNPRRTSEPKPERPINRPPSFHRVADNDDDSDHETGLEQPAANTPSLVPHVEGLKITDVDEDEFNVKPSIPEPRTALEHFEKAVEREDQGKLGDSLDHYRKAYKLDAKVDQTYKDKHYPTKSKPTNLNPSNAPVTVPGTAHHSAAEPSGPLTLADLVHRFAGEPIIGVPPIFKTDRPPPCTIRKLPNEVLVQVLRAVGTRDPALLARLSLVCKKLAYHVFTEDSIWRGIALGPEFGLQGQQYEFATDVQGREVIFETLEEREEEPLPPVLEHPFAKDTPWRELFQSYPRIRFSGVYISTVNYTRAGGASATQFTWSSPIHVITYYRYLRFFRDGTCISLLTTNEPLDVVHHLTPENLALVRSRGNVANHPLNFTSSAPALQHHPTTQGPTAPPSAQNLMKHALRGRWRLCHPSLTSTPTRPSDAPSRQTIIPGDVHIETEGAGPRYMYMMHLSMKSVSRSPHATKNNKLVWKSFWSYNNLANDWAQFGLKNDKPFKFSRVKSYGLGY